MFEDFFKRPIAARQRERLRGRAIPSRSIGTLAGATVDGSVNVRPADSDASRVSIHGRGQWGVVFPSVSTWVFARGLQEGQEVADGHALFELDGAVDIQEGENQASVRQRLHRFQFARVTVNAKVEIGTPKEPAGDQVCVGIRLGLERLLRPVFSVVESFLFGG
jgi:hypothetical protein